ncbi:MAG: response regulator [Desulfovibrio sp.]|nr:response regulator [Desulfovibrio sp.]MBI4959499.1 response regulator [Desulfovibrio sp.]
MGSGASSSHRILVADDEILNLRVLAAFLRDFGYEPVLVQSGAKVFEVLDESIDLVLLDVLMPAMDGFDVLRRIRLTPSFKDLPVIMVTALSGREERLAAVEAGASDFIAKPIDKTELRVRMESLLRVKQSQDELKLYQAKLEEMVDERTQALRLALENLQQMQLSIQSSQRETIFRLSAAAEHKDSNTASHIRRMSEYSALLAAKLGLPEYDVEVLRQASPMHDVGKMGIPDSILLKPGKLTPMEWAVMKGHCAIGRDILKDSDSELLQVAQVIAYSHHERFDGTGYPEGLSGKEIPLFGRICAVADVFDALTTPRPYKKAYSNKKAIGIMREEQARGPHFDPEIFALFLDNHEEFLNIQRKFQD